ncbi:hypothetical protein DRQ07_12220 [candidate division KSB1 bacterium]|nr:MAG: hypothetical protein DRQ07_12220 [candidate division KSB1 bacterium]
MHYKQITIVLILLLIPIFSSAEFYQYKDKNGVLHFTDNISEIPRDQRLKIKSYEEPSDYTAPEIKEEDNKSLKELNNSENDTGFITDETKKKEEEKVNDENLVRFNDLKNAKDRMDKERADLLKEKQTLIDKLKKPINNSRVIEYKHKIKALNERMADFNKRSQALQKKIDTFNELVNKQTNLNETIK